VGESPSARTERELTLLRATIGRDVDALVARVREDVDPRNLVRRQPLAVAGSLASLAGAVVVGFMRRARDARQKSVLLDAILDGFGGRIDRMKGSARREFRKQLAKEMAHVKKTGPKEAAYGAASAALAALMTTLAQGFGRRLLGDEPLDEREAQRRH
jgi:hypothetical protein